MTVRSDMELFIRLEPDIPKLTHQHGIKPVHAGGKTFMHKTPELVSLESRYIALLAPHKPSEPWDCPIHLTTVWTFLKPSKAHGIFKTTKPDTDNLVKTLKDCMKTAGYFKDDALVVMDTICKQWRPAGFQHGIHIRMRDLTGDNVD